MISKSLNRLVAIAVTSIFIATGFVALTVAPKAEAANAAQFDPGNIISDSVFYDFGTMTVTDIQRFLNGKLPTCNDNDGGPKCIRDFVSDTPAMVGESGRCESLPAQQNQTAAQIIFTVANACKINPRVLLVTLQKEQGLIQGGNPTKRMYDFAMGMNCPDTADCAKSSAGFFYQMYKGAGQLQWYGDPRGSFTYLRVGTKITRPHQAANVEASRGIKCGSQSFTLQSQATAALYYYTPYVPNAAALKNLYGTGDGCSAYGNRNFWRFYTDWFGNTIGGGFLLRASNTGTYFIVDDKKFLIDDPETVEALKPLGPLGTISQAYLDSFVQAGSMSRVVKSAAGVHFFVDGGKKYPFTNCAQATQFALDCATAVTLTASQLSGLATGNNMTEYIQGDNGQTFLIQDGFKRQILDTESLVDSRIGVPALSSVKITAFKKIPWGAPIIRKGVSFTNATANTLAIFDGKLSYDIDKATLGDIDFTKWFPKSTGTMVAEGLTAVSSTVALKSIVNSVDGSQYVLTNQGKRKVFDSKQLSKTAQVVSDAILSQIPDASSGVESTMLAKSAAATTIFLISEGVKRPLVTPSDALKFASAVKSTKVETLPNSVIAQIPTGSALVTPGSYVRLGRANYLIDGLARALVVSDSNQASLLGLKSPKTVTTAQLKGYSKTTKVSGVKFVCGTQSYVAITGKFYPIGLIEGSHYPGRGLPLDGTTCDSLSKSTTMLGRFVVSADKKYYLIEKQTKRLISSVSAYQKLRGSSPAAISVGPYFLSRIKTGAAAGSNMVTDAFESGLPPTPVVTQPGVTPSPIASPSPSVSPSPSASPSPSTSPSPSATASPNVDGKPATYRVVSGDTWFAILRKLSPWEVTDATLSAANPTVTNKNLIRVGQILNVP